MMDHRYHRVKWGAGEIRIRTTKDYWQQPIRWNGLAAQAGVRERVFCASLADVCDGERPEDLGPWRDELWELGLPLDRHLRRHMRIVFPKSLLSRLTCSNSSFESLR